MQKASIALLVSCATAKGPPDDASSYVDTLWDVLYDVSDSRDVPDQRNITDPKLQSLVTLLEKYQKNDLSCRSGEFDTNAAGDVCMACDEWFPNSRTCDEAGALTCDSTFELQYDSDDNGQCLCPDGKYDDDGRCKPCEYVFNNAATCTEDEPLTCIEGWHVVDN